MAEPFLEGDYPGAAILRVGLAVIFQSSVLGRK